MISRLLTEPLASVRYPRWIFLRVLALVNIAAFASLAVQIQGLIGSHGILPASRWLRESNLSFPELPTFGWLSCSDSALQGACWSGIVCAVLLLFDVCPPLMLVKLESHDPHWHDLSALKFHFWTQPIPNPLAWYANRLPDPAQSASVLAMFAIELLVPFLFFTPWARLAFLPLVGFQVLIGVTGNYGFFNLLTIALCLSCLDDRTFRFTTTEPKMPNGTTWCTSAIFLLLFLNLPLRLFPAWRLVNSYGLFAQMTTERLEIELEGSADGLRWEPYVFRYKPGPMDRRPPELGLHMPRLDCRCGSPRSVARRIAPGCCRCCAL